MFFCFFEEMKGNEKNNFRIRKLEKFLSTFRHMKFLSLLPTARVNTKARFKVKPSKYMICGETEAKGKICTSNENRDFLTLKQRMLH